MSAEVKRQDVEAITKDVEYWLDGLEDQVVIGEEKKNLKAELRDLAYKAQDVLDDWESEQLRPVANSSVYLDFQDTKRKRDEIYRAYAHLLPQPRTKRPDKEVKSHQLQSSLPTEREIRGRESETEKILKFLKERALLHQLSVVPVLGAAGVGKTTLLQHIYNDPSFQDSKHFKFMKWVPASGEQTMMNLMKQIVEPSCNFNGLDAVQRLLKQNLDGQRSLLVLDDVRFEAIEGGEWEKLLAVLSGCDKGSVIILSTQDKRVAHKTKTVPVFKLNPLSAEQCWSVIKKHALSGSWKVDTLVEKTGKQIAKECQGNPLVAKALGIELRREGCVEWQKIFDGRDMWHERVPQLRLGYHNLPARLKRCFVYCSVFPQGNLFNKEELVQLWKAQGFVRRRDLGLQYFDELYTMSFFRVSELDSGAFVMPNVLHSLARSISDGECVTSDCSSLPKIQSWILSKARHLSLNPGDSELSSDFPFCRMEKLRSFLVLPTWPVKTTAQISLSEDKFRYLEHLRILDLRHTCIEALPGAISMLKHLRYLNLSGSKIAHVHESVLELYHLQTLDLSCTNIKELPDAIGNLGKLLHLYLNVTKVTKLPESIGELTKLQSLHLGLTKVEEVPNSIGSLQCVTYLCLNVSRVQVLPESICGLSSMQILELQGAGYEGLNEALNLQNVESVHGEDWDMDDGSTKCSLVDAGEYSSSDASRQNSTCKNFQKHVNSQLLDTSFWRVEKLRNRMREPTIPNKLARVVVSMDMKKCKSLPQLGQLPLLKELYIDGMSIEHVGKEFCGSGDRNGFPSLKKLYFQNMSELKKWDGVGASDFPRLQELIIFNCPNLKDVPCFCSSLTKLKLERCAVESIPKADSLKELELVACDGLFTLPPLSSLRKITLMYCKNLSCSLDAQSMENFWIEECEKLAISSPEKCVELSQATFVGKKFW